MRKLIALLTLALTSCVTSDQATEVLQKSGFTNITINGTNIFSCGKDDNMNGANFTATNSRGMVVNGVVCCGLMKGCTVRF